MKDEGVTRGKLAKQTGCNTETIRYYEKIGIMPDPPRSSSGYRFYDDHHQRRLRFIMKSRELGFSIEDIKSLLGLVDCHAVSCAEVEKIAKAHLLLVHQKISELHRIADALSLTVKQCSGNDVPECPLIDTLFEASD